MQLNQYLILDGIACALVGARLPWSETAAQAVFAMESPGPCTIYGWETNLGPLPAALLNSTFIQGFELEDYHSDAPLHSNSLVIPALLAAAEHESNTPSGRQPFTGVTFLLAVIIGCEVGPRIGLALNGTEMLNRGWHSGAVFGPPPQLQRP
ncbi:hypothetical protein BDV29DRAFT_162959 [Aspergillus leporis]|uniref:MmgE/PrpD N-terminal domain-containing protein n=1 Tax=Aspergillus leporis TaxID=41062 RepID=A0A5N5WHC8_9EURO|nr:hypothetical protein BDV29DRAFT_162959 [Aspergillus leporis]